MAPYETPGTQAFAETILPFVHDHNTILLSNHGIVCWSDSVTHAEWRLKKLRSLLQDLAHCATAWPAARAHPRRQTQEFLAIKRRLGLPDARLAWETPEPPALEKHPAEIDELAARVMARF